MIFNQPQNAVAFDLYDTDSSDEYRLLIDGVNQGNEYEPNMGGFDGTGFFGVIDMMTSFTTLTFQSFSPGGFVEEFGIDNLRFARGQQIAEPGTLALFGLGLAGLGFARRRKAA